MKLGEERMGENEGKLTDCPPVGDGVIAAPNRASTPVASVVPKVSADPASVTTDQESDVARVKRRMILLQSATYTSSLGETAIAVGWRKRAAEPIPSVLPGAPALPAIVVTVPEGEIRRMTWLKVSATNTLPAASTAVPTGFRYSACIAAPSRNPSVPETPENVVTSPTGVIRRNTCEFPSATNAFPPASTVIPNGPTVVVVAELIGLVPIAANRAAVPFPSSEPTSPARPATVLTTPSGVILRTRWLTASVTYRLPWGSTAMPHGRLNRAVSPGPSMAPDVTARPAMVQNAYCEEGA